jgi:hypothetical protein
VAETYPDGPIFYSTTHGASWSQATATPEEWIAVACSASGKQVAAVAENFPYSPVFTSRNTGAAWSTTASYSAGWSSVASSADGKTLAAGAGGGSVVQSLDGGTTWTDTSATYAAWTGLALSADGSQLAAAGSGVGIFILTAPLAPPVITGLSLQGADAVISGTQAAAGHVGILWTTENLAPAAWTPVATNVFAASGAFTFTATNAVWPQATQQFYRLTVQ